MAPYARYEFGAESICWDTIDLESKTPIKEKEKTTSLLRFLTDIRVMKALWTITVLLGLLIIYHQVDKMTTEETASGNGNRNVVVEEFVQDTTPFSGVINGKDPTTAKWRPKWEGYH